jgi:hypothetical protein
MDEENWLTEMPTRLYDRWLDKAGKPWYTAIGDGSLGEGQRREQAWYRKSLM